MTQTHFYQTAGEFEHWSCKQSAAALGNAIGSITRITRTLGLRTMLAVRTADPADMTAVDIDRWAKLMAADRQLAWLELLGLIRRAGKYSPEELREMIATGGEA